MIDYVYKDAYNVKDLQEIVRILRSPGGCPWDQVQTHESIRRNFLEEAYEVAEAIDEGSQDHLKEELGDVLLQVLFHARIEEEQDHFDLDDVADGICRKLIYRHPHVFGKVTVSGTDEVLDNWEVLKQAEKGQQTPADAVDAVARSLPALWRAEKVQKKAAKAGFDWPDASGAFQKLREELAELEEASRQADAAGTFEELGDLLFSAVNAARFLQVDPEDALTAASDKFARRFRRVVELAARQGRALDQLPPEQLEALWQQAKQV